MYDYEGQAHPGQKNQLPDMLSRLLINTDKMALNKDADDEIIMDSVTLERSVTAKDLVLETEEDEVFVQEKKYI